MLVNSLRSGLLGPAPTHDHSSFSLSPASSMNTHHSNQTDAHPHTGESISSRLPLSSEDFDFNIDFDTAFSNIPIDIPSSILQENPEHLLLQDANGGDSISDGHYPDHAFHSRFFSPNVPANAQIGGGSERSNNIMENDLAKGFSRSQEKAPLFNAQESSMISQFFEKINADPEFIFSPKLDEGLLNLTEHDGVASPAFSILGQNDYKNSRPSQFGSSSELASFNSSHKPTATTPGAAWDIPTPEGILPLMNSTQFMHSQQTQPELQESSHDIYTTSNSTVPTTVPDSKYGYQTGPNLRKETQYAVPTQRGAKPDPDALRQLPIMFGTDPSFQDTGFQPSYSLSSAIRSRDMPPSEDKPIERHHAGQQRRPEYASGSVNSNNTNYNPGAVGISDLPVRANMNGLEKPLIPKPYTSNDLRKQIKPEYSLELYDMNNSTTSIGTDAINNDTKEAGVTSTSTKGAVSRRKSTVKNSDSEATITTRPRRENLSEDQKRINHISSEKRRRDLIKSQFKEMCSLVPKLAETDGNNSAAAVTNQSKSTVLQVVYEYILLMFEKNSRLRQFLAENNVNFSDIKNSTIPSKDQQ